MGVAIGVGILHGDDSGDESYGASMIAAANGYLAARGVPLHAEPADPPDCLVICVKSVVVPFVWTVDALDPGGVRFPHCALVASEALFLPVDLPLPAGPVTGLDTVDGCFGSSSGLLDECERLRAELPDDLTVLDSLTDQERERIYAADMCGRLVLAARRSIEWGAALVIG